MQKTACVNLPLHSGRAPYWLFKRMIPLAGLISEAIVLEYGKKEFLKRISNPYFFQALSCVLGFDWHSSGTTTTTCGALKMALRDKDIGVKFFGGKGGTSRKTPIELRENPFNLKDEKIEKLVY